VNRRGAYAETRLAVGRARAAGLSAGGNVFLTTASLPQLDELTAALQRLPINADLSFETAAFLPTPRSRRNEPLRPTLTDLLPVAAQIAELTAPASRPWWADLEAHTEAAYVRRARAGDWPAARDRTPGELALVCRPNLDVCSGLAGHYRPGRPGPSDGVGHPIVRLLAADAVVTQELRDIGAGRLGVIG
jgi:hypothetical protein